MDISNILDLKEHLTMPLEASRPLSRALMRDEVYTRLLHAIVNLELEPGERINDQEIAALLGVSRMPVREALRRLEDAGFAESAAGRWTRVAPVDLREARDLYGVVLSLELRGFEESAGQTDLELLRESNRRLQESIRSGRYTESSAADRDFHRALIAPSTNRVLHEILEQQRLRLARIENAFFRDSTRAMESVREHDFIVHALARSDVAAARAALIENWTSSLARLEVSHARIQGQ